MKLLTNEIIEAELVKRGVREIQIADDPSGFTVKVLNHYEARVDDRWADQDLYVYEESTRDGYSVWVCTHNPNSICINEDVYQYEQSTDVINRFEEAIRNGQSVYCDDEDFIEQVCDGMIDTFLDDVRADVEMEFHDKGYAWPPKIPALLKEIRNILTADAVIKHQSTVTKIDTALEQLNNAD